MNALYEGRHCLVNSPMVEGTALTDACVVADTPYEVCEALAHLMEDAFSEEERLRRIHILEVADPMHDIKSLI